ncbi:trypsin-like serine protease [Lacticaseibacillus camelliae DSM 22697 = JCM 13995]|uniref:Trypsin-like serine protease n=1 Tax=Lacticaseibacillus camelliae DSM 22697 = JCM 13995 TaxID=1423730 RepID=A0A0R2F5H2_9LACO|nr:trypsin-like serine protease [Lacticaseibacillus camelliae DSM 22697 = JCM 13995]
MFGTSIDRHWTNWWAGLLGGIGCGLILSLMLVLLGATLPQPVMLMSGLLEVLALLLSGLGFAPWFLALAGLIVVLPAWFGPVPAPARWAGGYVAMVALVWLANALLLRFLNPAVDVPKLRPGKRGARIATYSRRQWYWLPLVLPVPGDWLQAFGWWPTLGIGATRFALVGLPLIVGAALTTRKQLPTRATDAWAWQYLGAGLVALIVAGLVYWRPAAGQMAIFALAALGCILGLANWAATRRGTGLISQTSTGVRIVAVQPDTPASKMGLVAGDIVLTCNHQAVHTENELYAALQTSPTYCRLKVMRLDGAIRLAETAVFNGVPHELGMITFAEEQA